jgi:predicted component of type VI protein secretion system
MSNASTIFRAILKQLETYEDRLKKHRKLIEVMMRDDLYAR